MMPEIFEDSKYKYLYSSSWLSMLGVGFGASLTDIAAITNVMQNNSMQSTIQSLQSQIDKLKFEQTFLSLNSISNCNINQCNNMIVNMTNVFPPLSTNVTEREKPKKKLTIHDVDRIIFPNDPIRDYIEAEIARIEEKYKNMFSWVDDFEF